MRKLFALLLLFALLPAAVQARTHTGPISLRGVAGDVSSRTFSLHTRTRGTIAVQLRAQTRVSRKGYGGAVSLHDGDHVGVRGFLSGRSLVAISVRIYPVKSKPFTVKGIVRSVGKTTITIDTGTKHVTGRLTASTVANVGIGLAVLRHVRAGDRVAARMVGAGRPQVLTLHLYITHVAARHVTFSGTIKALSRTSITVDTGSGQTRVGVNGSTALVMGIAHVNANALHAGMRVTVRACCVGRPLVAISVRISRVKPPHSVLLHGAVRKVAGGTLIVQVGRRVVVISVGRTARVTEGSALSTLSRLRVNDEISVRAVPSGKGYVASSVHVFVKTRRSLLVIGIVVSASRTSVVVTTSSGRRWTITTSPGTSIHRSGRTTTLAGLRVGDTVHARGHVRAGADVVADTVTASPAPLKQVRVRGIVIKDSAGSLTIATTSGARVTVRFAPGVHPTLHGTVAPTTALFVGVRVSVRGVARKTIVIASRVAVEAISRHVNGRVLRNTGAWLTVLHGSRVQIKVDIPARLQATDGGHRLPVKAIREGAYVSVDGYEVTVGHMRATVIRLRHPSLNIAGNVVVPGRVPTVNTSNGQRYLVHLRRGATVTVGRYSLPVALADVPLGSRVRVLGIVQSDGSVLATTVTVSLRSSVLRGSVIAVGPPVSVRTATGTLTIRLAPAASVMQGSRPSELGRLVLGDDVTLHGYRLAGGVMLTRALDLHRRLMALTGDIVSLTATGFLLDLSGRQIEIVLLPTTVVSGTEPSPAPGYAVHVTGYLRGDGVIEATRIKMGKRQP